MSYYDDQEEAWFANDCKGSPGDYDPYDPDSWPKKHVEHSPAAVPVKLTKSQKRNRARKRAKAAKDAESGITAIELAIVLVAAFVLILWGFAVYTGFHFIAKYW